MKRLIQIAFLASCMIVYMPSHAQFVKKTQKESKTAENTVTKKSADKTYKEVGKDIDGIFSEIKKKADKKIASPDHYYRFDYQYKMKITSDENTVKMDYFFQPSGDYAGMAMNNEGMKMFMVFDYNKEAMYSFISGQTGEMYTSTALNLSTDKDRADDKYTRSNYTVTNLPNKTILGYSCKGKQIENDEWKFTMYYTNEVGISFQNILNASKNGSSPSVLSKYFKEAEDGLMLYMKSVDKKQQDYKAVTMECIGLDKEEHDFSTKNYDYMGF